MYRYCIAFPDTMKNIVMDKSIWRPNSKDLLPQTQICPHNIFQSIEFTPTTTTRAPEARAHGRTAALLMLWAGWTNCPRGPIKATHRRQRQVTQESSRRSSNRGCRAASATPVPTRRRERTTSPRHKEPYFIYLHHVKCFFSFCGVVFFSTKP